MRIVAISDTHTRHSRLTIPECDVLIHAGDCSNSGSRTQIQDFWAWMDKQPAKYKLFVPGNHDIACEYGLRPEPGIIYLQDRGVTIEGVKFWGIPWMPQYGDWAFMLPRGPQLAAKWATIPNDTQVLITHGPPHGVLDYGAGDEDLSARLRQLHSLRLHVFGHIHEGAGEIWRYGVKYVNAAMTTPTPRDPVVLDWKFGSIVESRNEITSPDVELITRA